MPPTPGLRVTVTKPGPNQGKAGVIDRVTWREGPACRVPGWLVWLRLAGDVDRTPYSWEEVEALI